MKRRDFLKALGLVPLAAYLPTANAGPLAGKRKVVLVELKGGNDGLNTVVPYTDPAYYAARPTLAIQKRDVLRLDDAIGLHPALSPLMTTWKAKELAVVMGVGYPKPNRSHFRSIDIWETASGADEYRSEGWVGALWRGHSVVEGIAVGGGALGPLAGGRALSIRKPDAFLRIAKKLHKVSTKDRNPALRHIVNVQNDLVEAARVIETHLSRGLSPKGFPKNPFASQLEVIAKLILSDLPTPVFQVTLAGFDTHSNQPGAHRRLLGVLATGLKAFRATMRKHKRWDDVVIMTYSEFGRRVAENGSGGTDHGTVAPHFMLGGRVVGGLYGAQPSLVNLRDRDMKHSVDYRELYATLAKRWWKLKTPLLQSFAPLPLVG